MFGIMTRIARKSTVTVVIRKMWMVNWLALTSMILSVVYVAIRRIRFGNRWFYSDRRR